MKYVPLFSPLVLALHTESPIAVDWQPGIGGEIIAVSDDRKTVTILQSGSNKREITITKKTKLSFVGMGKKSQELKVGTGEKRKSKMERLVLLSSLNR